MALKIAGGERQLEKQQGDVIIVYFVSMRVPITGTAGKIGKHLPR